MHGEHRGIGPNGVAHVGEHPEARRLHLRVPGELGHCHGQAGDAKGTVSSRIGAPSLLTGRARAYSDGYIYGIIRYGRGVMPRYGDKVYQPAERWAIVNHVRKLQAASPPPQEPPGAAAPIAPAPSATGSTGGRPR